ncbi:NAD(P)/FAD-dependent oxidoreductase [Larkinella harenae]
MLIQDKKIAIVGGGPGGLTLARLLQLQGATVSVYERDANPDGRVQGATLDLHDDSGLAAIRKAGLLEAFKAHYRPGADKMRIVDQHGTVLFEDGFAADDQLFRPEIDRGPLRTILLESLHPDTVVWNRHFVSMTPNGSGWQLAFQNGTSAKADLVIAADGANSRIRSLITPLKPLYAGITMVEGAVYQSEKTVPELHRLLNGGKVFALGDEKTLIVSSKGDGSLVFYTGCKTDEGWVRSSGIDFRNKPQVTAWFRQEFSGWDALWLDLFAKAEGDFIPRPQYYMPLDQTWETQPNLTLLGDAAHLMPPYAGEGVNMAMLDALELSECLTSRAFPDLRAALTAYETQMRARAAEMTQMTLHQTDSMHSTTGLTGMLAMFA